MGLTPSSRGFVLGPPPLNGSWLYAPANPAHGVGGLRLEDLEKDDFKFYCDPCQKGFNSRRLFEEHMGDHIYCEYPGCKFTCRKAKEWKMEIHVSSLHNRPDAPNLADTEAYLSSRKKRFPKVETVKQKVEELYYRAARGELLPDERRRWLRQHGVYVSRQWYLPVLREGDEALELSRQRRADRKRQRDATGGVAGAAGHHHHHQQQQQQVPQQPRPSQPSAAGPTADPAVAADTAASAAAAAASGDAGGDDGLAKYARRPGERMLPLGPNGRFTKSQLVQLVRERYDAARKVPSFYVCNRCGEKGHWVEACPKSADKRFDAETNWGEEKRPNPYASTSSVAGAVADPEAGGVQTHTGGLSGGEGGAADAGATDAPVEESARPPAGAEDDPDNHANTGAGVTRTFAPALQARHEALKKRSALRAATADEDAAVAAHQRRGAHAAQRRQLPRAPGLFDRLTAEQHLNAQGVLLQAIRFFVANEFLVGYHDTAVPLATTAEGSHTPSPTAGGQGAPPYSATGLSSSTDEMASEGVRVAAASQAALPRRFNFRRVGPNAAGEEEKPGPK
jgi:hypothetical protein